MTKDTKGVKSTNKLPLQDKVMGYAAIIIFAAGTLRAVQQEASHSSVMVYALGVAVVAFGLGAAFRLINHK